MEVLSPMHWTSVLAFNINIVDGVLIKSKKYLNMYLEKQLSYKSMQQNPQIKLYVLISQLLSDFYVCLLPGNVNVCQWGT